MSLDPKLLEILKALSDEDVEKCEADSWLYGNVFVHAARQVDGSMRARRLDPSKVQILGEKPARYVRPDPKCDRCGTPASRWVGVVEGDPCLCGGRMVDASEADTETKWPFHPWSDRR